MAYPHGAEYKRKGKEEPEQVKKPHLAPLCERCKRGLECSAANQEELARLFDGLRV